MKYDFDRIIDRKNTDSVKFDFMEENNRASDTIPLWVADMDFAVPDEIIDEIRKTCDHGIFGYASTKGDYYEAVSGWFTRRFGWTPKESWMIKIPGVVIAFSIAIQALTEPDDAVLIQTPVYYPFFNAINRNHRKLIENPLVREGLTYKIDFDDFEEKIKANNVKMFILCSPHNPVGRVWTKDELRRMAEICDKYNVIIVADEIHCDLTFPEHPHTMMLDACKDYKHRIISCTAPSKTFNIAGLQASNIWIPSEDLRDKYVTQMDKVGFFTLNNIAIVACKAAYKYGDEWLDQCLEYIYANYEFMKDYISKNIPSLKVMDLQGTYLAWVDFSGLNMTPEEVDDVVSNKAKLWLDEGKMFGPGGENYQRFVLACPRATLKEALDRLASALA